MSTALALNLPSPVGNLDAYRRAVQSVPLLAAEEERELARRFREHDDLNAAWHLVASHLRFVVRVAREYSGYGLPQEDLIQEGNVGLMKAVRRFDSARGVRLVSFAAHWIRAEIQEFILKNWRIVKVATTKARRKLFYRLRSAKKRLEWLKRSEAAAIAEDLGVTQNEVLEMERSLYTRDKTFDGPADEVADGPHTPMDYVQDCRFEPEAHLAETEWTAYATRRLHAALGDLDKRSRDIIERRWLGDDAMTLQELATEYGVTAERIRQIEAKAMKTMRERIA